MSDVHLPYFISSSPCRRLNQPLHPVVSTLVRRPCFVENSRRLTPPLRRRLVVSNPWNLHHLLTPSPPHGGSASLHHHRKRGPRGTNLDKNIPADSSQRKVIHISGLNYLEHEVVRAITKDFKALFSGEETQWHQLDEDLVEIFYKSFQDRYQYEDNVEHEIARHVWEERAKIRFGGLWALVRKNCKKKTNSTNPADWRLVCPKFVHKEDWDGILASWMTEKWKKRSTAGAANRKVVPGDEAGSYVRHTGGCVSFEIHRTRWEIELGIEMTEIELFEKLHKKDKGKGDRCDLRVERAATKYCEIVKKKNDVDDLVDIPYDGEAWVEATGFTKNSNGYGFGLTKQADWIYKKAKRSYAKRSRRYTSRMDDEAWIESEVNRSNEFTNRCRLKCRNMLRNSWSGCKTEFLHSSDSFSL